MSKRSKRNKENKIRALTKCPYCGQLFNYRLFNQHLEIIHGLQTIKKRRPTTFPKKEILDLNEERTIRGTQAEADMTNNRSIQPKKLLSNHETLKKNHLTSMSKNLVTTKPNISQANKTFNLYIKETFKKDNYTIRDIGTILNVDSGQVIKLIFKKTKKLLSENALIPRMLLLKSSNELNKLPTKAEKLIKKENNKEKNDKRMTRKKEKEKPPKGNRSVRLILIGHPHD